MHQIQYNDPEQHTAQTDTANHPVIHLFRHRQHCAPAIRADKGQHAFNNEYEPNSNRKHLPEVHTHPRIDTSSLAP
jgi:hypothetical protein